MLHKDVVAILQRQINFELHSSNIYLQMASWCKTKGYQGAADFFKGHADEEYFHMEKIWKYLEDNGVRPTLGTIPAVDFTGVSLKDTLEKAYEHEKFVTAAINQCVDQANQVNDHKTFNFLQWYVDEQVEEEQLFSDLLAKFEIAGEDNLSIYLIDKDLASVH